MPRLPGLRAALLALALSPLPLGACSSHGADGGAAAEALTPLPAPAGHLGDVFLAAPGATWGKARGSLGQGAAFLPQSFGGVAATLVGLPITLSAEIDEAVPVIGSAARQGRGPVQIALGLHVKSGDRFLGMVTRGEGARFNATVDPATHVTLLTDKVAPESARFALGVLGNYLLVAARPADLYALGPYVVRTLGPAPAPKDDLAFELPEQALAGPLLDEVRELRSQGEGASATLVPLATLLDTATTVLGDASHARLAWNLDAAAATLHGRLAVTPKAGGAASKLLADLVVGDVKPLLDLPDSTTFGLLWRESAASRAESAPRQADALARLLGSDVTAGDKAAISAALGAEAEARGDWQALGVAFNGTGPTAMVRAPVADAERMKKALQQLVDLGGLASFKKALAGLGVRLASDKAVVENLPGDVTRVRLSHPADDAKDTKKDPKAKPAADKKPPPSPSPGETPKAIDLLYMVEGGSLYAAAGFDPRDSLRSLVKAPTGGNLGASAPIASALAPVGGEAVFVLVADALRMMAMTTGRPPQGTQAPLVIAAGRTSAPPAELWARVDVPTAVVQQLFQEYTRRRGAPSP